MKFWKRTACLALGATMSFGVFTACGETGDNSGDSEQKRREQARAAAKTYVDTVSDTLESTKSFNVSGKVTLGVKDEYFGADGKTIDSALTEEDKMALYLDVNLTQDGEDNVAMSMTAKSEEIEVAVGGKEISYQRVMEIIVKDGFAYGRSYMTDSEMSADELAAAKGKWDKAEITLPEEMPPIDAAFVNQLLNASELKEFGAQILGGAQEIITEKFFNGEVANGKVAWTKNYAADINAVIAFIESIDETKDTLGDVLNRVLAEIDEDLTVEGILDTVKAYKDKTVAEVFTEIDAELAKKNTSLQGIYDAIVNSEIVTIILAEMDIPVENLVALKAFKLDVIKAQYGTMQLDTLVNMAVEMMKGMSGADSVEPTADDLNDTETDLGDEDYWANAIFMAETALSTTLADLGITMADCSAVVMNDLTIDTGLKLNAEGNGLETLYLSIDFGVRTGNTDTVYDEVAEEYKIVLVGYEYSVLSADLTISSFSASTIAINAPAESEIEVEADGGADSAL